MTQSRRQRPRRATPTSVAVVPAGGPVVEVRAPFDNALLGEIAESGGDEAVAAIASAAAAMEKPFPAYLRAAVLERLAGGLADARTDLAELLAREVGKPVKSAVTEVDRAVCTLTFCAAEARKLSGEVIPMEASNTGASKVAFTLLRPIGVVGAITPFNFPLNLACHKVGPAIAAGCAVVLKPSEKAPLTAFELRRLARDAGLPEGWLHVLTGRPSEIADAFVTDGCVGLISFTGSAEVGWRLRRRAERKRVALELGTSTPVVVDETVAPSAVATAIATSAFGSAGQSCISAQRVYADRAVARPLATRLAGIASCLVVGDPLDPSTDVGPLITESAAARVFDAVEEARSSGAEVLAGGAPNDGALLRPTVLWDPDPAAGVVRDELFGPVVSVIPTESLEGALAAANATAYGLQAAVYSARLDRVMAAVAALEFGGVIVNDIPSFRADQMPYGGVKQSGVGREGPAYAIREMCEEKLVVIDTETSALYTSDAV